MITEPPTDGQRTPLQDFETLYIGRVPSLPSFAGPLSAMSWQNQDLAKSRLCAVAKEGLTTRMARIVLVTVFGDGSYGNKHEVER
jgi:hypothetical protein